MKRRALAAGSLPPPTSPRYAEMEKDCRVQFYHVLVTAPDIATYKQRVIARGRAKELPRFLPLYQRLLRHRGIYDQVVVV